MRRYERARPDATIGLDFPRSGGAAFRRRHRGRLRLRTIGRRPGVCGRAVGNPVRYGVRGGPSCRGDRRADRRALWHAVVDAVGHHHRSCADRNHHARSQGGADAGARYGLCRGHDRMQRPCRRLHPGRRPTLSRAGLSSFGRQSLFVGAGRARDHHAGAPELHADDAGTVVFRSPAWFRQHRDDHPLLCVSLYADDPAP